MSNLCAGAALKAAPGKDGSYGAGNENEFDAKKRAASARERALRTHDITANVNKLLNAYQKIVGE